MGGISHVVALHIAMVHGVSWLVAVEVVEGKGQPACNAHAVTPRQQLGLTVVPEIAAERSARTHLIHDAQVSPLTDCHARVAQQPNDVGMLEKAA